MAHCDPLLIFNLQKNILINDNGEACITDFGVARAVECSGFTTIAGSYRWMAPEFFDEISSLTTAVDVWAFAMTVLEVGHRLAPT
jgi:serine/threonine protein kinase